MKNLQITRPKSWLEAYVPLLLWGVFIFILSAQSVLPGLHISTGDFLFKKSAHMFVYAVLYIFTLRAVFFHTPKVHTSLWFVPILICLVYATSDEIHQSFVPYRSASIRDLAYDMLGVTAVFLKKYSYI